MTDENKITVQDIKRTHFNMAELEKAGPMIEAVIAAVQKEQGVEDALIKTNFDMEKEFPEGYGVVIQPINQKVEREVDGKKKKIVEVIGVAIGAIPDYDAIMADKDGAEWARLAVYTAMIQKFANATREDASDELVPFAIEDFCTSRRPEGVLNGYREVAPKMIAALKKQGMKWLTDAIFRQCLTSSAYAEQTFPNVAQEKWELIIDKMIEACSKSEISAGVMVDWKETRKNAGLPDIKDIDLSGLDI